MYIQYTPFVTFGSNFPSGMSRLLTTIAAPPRSSHATCLQPEIHGNFLLRNFSCSARVPPVELVTVGGLWRPIGVSFVKRFSGNGVCMPDSLQRFNSASDPSHVRPPSCDRISPLYVVHSNRLPLHGSSDFCAEFGVDQ